MSFFKKLFGSHKPRTLWDTTKEIATNAVIYGYRKIGKERGCAPTQKTSDDKIIEIYSKIVSSFQKAASEKNERIPAVYLNFIALKFLQVYELAGDAFVDEHLDYEINLYKTSGLRNDYKQELNLL
jgi:hypothetical protein